ncbi:5,10-methylenetetrahydromethanopterin reductase [Halanaeroarchaeum sulfurireducens]|uniref:5,10-methylenetetrahydromethanopterin reductase n=1 Tax=Halanaeroarchaeum sulfurireducens TaxID=1604004 RepID=A0A0F7P871_9EURY|nr:5,10-methylenetetrahydromethanopterin reductase [Halanaeroarchaeum sulfurireducens]AKH96922.1 5,10-methylenetetrahydromethanopterin reductase [Halanaeroarchaeum sulfurireducens]ALG81324.1 5,10-methylenetetrahydromethanopterin reductase [Halanaeroarchaeum sulfurireducens]
MRGIELTPEIPVQRVVDLGSLAEEAGFDTVFVSSHYNNRDPFQALARLAAETETVRLGPGVANPYETHPVTLTSQVATLAESSDDRAVFGVGAGDRSTLRNLGIDRERPLRRVLETMRVARRLFAGERVTHDGTFTVRDAGLNYDVGDVPVYVGAQGPHMLRMAGKYADGVLVNASHPADVSWSRDRIEEGIEEREGSLGAPDIAVYASVSVAAEESAARAAARPPVAFIAGGADEHVLDRHGVDAETAARIGDHVEAGRFEDAFDAVTGRMLDAFSVAGTVETVAARFESLLAHADSVVVGAPLGPDRSRAVELAAEAIDQVDENR